MGVMKELYFDSWKSESYPYAGITRIRFKGYNLSLAAPHSFRGAKVENMLFVARRGVWNVKNIFNRFFFMHFSTIRFKNPLSSKKSVILHII